MLTANITIGDYEVEVKAHICMPERSIGIMSAYVEEWWITQILGPVNDACVDDGKPESDVIAELYKHVEDDPAYNEAVESELIELYNLDYDHYD